MMANVQEVTPAFNTVKEYLDRKKLAELGFTSPMEYLDQLSAERLLAVADEIQRAEHDVLPKLKPRAKGGRSNN
jgi:hypothetical protein